MTRPDPDKLRLRWIEKKYAEEHDEPDEGWYETPDTLDYYER